MDSKRQYRTSDLMTFNTDLCLTNTEVTIDSYNNNHVTDIPKCIIYNRHRGIEWNGSARLSVPASSQSAIGRVIDQAVPSAPRWPGWRWIRLHDAVGCDLGREAFQRYDGRLGAAFASMTLWATISIERASRRQADGADCRGADRCI